MGCNLEAPVGGITFPEETLSIGGGYDLNELPNDISDLESLVDLFTCKTLAKYNGILYTLDSFRAYHFQFNLPDHSSLKDYDNDNSFYFFDAMNYDYESSGISGIKLYAVVMSIFGVGSLSYPSYIGNSHITLFLNVNGANYSHFYGKFMGLNSNSDLLEYTNGFRLITEGILIPKSLIDSSTVSNWNNGSITIQHKIML